MPEPARAAIYTRMSYVLDDDQTKVLDQERVARELAASRGIEVAAVYCDNNRSAWQRDRKRPGWDAMLADVDAGRVNVIITYHGDRLIRQPHDLEKLLLLAESKGVRLISVAGTRDLDSSDDRFILRIEVAQACKSSDDTSRRQKRQFERWALEGRAQAAVSGGRRMGYTASGLALWASVEDGPVEADMLREAATRILAGESRRSVAADLTRRGFRAPSGADITATRLRDWLANPRYAGLMPDGVSRAAWPAIIDRAAWEALRTLDASIAAANPRPTNASRWLLSGIATCSRCDSPLHISGTGDGYSAYVCPAHHVRRNAPQVDAYVSARAAARLADDRNPAGRRPASPGIADAWKVLEDEHADTERLLAEYGAKPGRARLLMSRLDGIEARMEQLRQLADTSHRSRLLAQYQGIALEAFLALPLDVRRALVRALFTVTVLPASKRGPGFHREDVLVEPVLLGSMSSNRIRALIVTAVTRNVARNCHALSDARAYAGTYLNLHAIPGKPLRNVQRAANLCHLSNQLCIYPGG